MSRLDDTTRDGYFTTYSLKYPFAQCVDTVGTSRVTVWANNADLPAAVMKDLQAAFAKTNRDLREILRDKVVESERRAVPLACIILGKS